MIKESSKEEQRAKRAFADLLPKAEGGVDGLSKQAFSKAEAIHTR